MCAISHNIPLNNIDVYGMAVVFWTNNTSREIALNSFCLERDTYSDVRHARKFRRQVQSVILSAVNMHDCVMKFNSNVNI